MGQNVSEKKALEIVYAIRGGLHRGRVQDGDVGYTASLMTDKEAADYLVKKITEAAAQARREAADNVRSLKTSGTALDSCIKNAAFDEAISAIPQGNAASEHDYLQECPYCGPDGTECRAAFEKWGDDKLDLDRMANGGKYMLSSTEIQWGIWQAAWKEARK